VRIVGHGPGEFESAHEYRTRTEHGVGGLRAEATRLDAKGTGLTERLLRQRIHRTARVTHGAEYAVRALHNDGEIGPGLMSRFSLANPGDTENEK
jgi:hypothetical protein